MDVPVAMHYKFQQSSLIYSGRYLSFRSSTECWTAQFLVGRLHARCCANDRAWVRQWRKLWHPQLLSSDKVLDVPGVPVVQIFRCRCGADSRLPQLQLLRNPS